MLWGWIALFGFGAQLEIAGVSRLEAAAQASARPEVCAASSSLWVQAARPNLARYCRFLARGHGALRRAPEQALLWGQRAHQLVPERLEAAWLMAEAHVELGQFGQAEKWFSSAQSAVSELTRAPASLHRYAISAVQNGQAETGALSYQQLLTRVSLLADPVRATRAYVEGAWAIYGAHPERGRQALAYLAEAKRRGGSLMLPETTQASRALLEALAGHADESQRLLQTVRLEGLKRELESKRGSVAPTLLPLVRQSLLALSEAGSSPRVRQLWQALWPAAEKQGGPWKELVRARSGHAP